MAAFRPNFVATRTLQFLELINNTQKDDLPKYLLLRTLGLCISVCPPPAEQRRQVLGLVWRYISSLNIPEQYISCAEVWVQFTVQHFMVSNALKKPIYINPDESVESASDKILINLIEKYKVTFHIWTSQKISLP